MKNVDIISLKNQKQFDFVNKYGKKNHSTNFIVISTNSVPEFLAEDLPYLSFGMKVSRRFSKKAVIRNKVKRRIRHLIRLLAHDETLNILNKSLIIIPKNGFHIAEFAQLYNEFKKFF